MFKLKKTKECPKCKKKNIGAKVRFCPNKKCDNIFTFNKIIKNSKKCSSCFIENRPRAKECYICKFKFPEKKKKGYEEISMKSWRQLKRGDIIYLRKGARGPYYEGENGKILMGYRGQFKIRSIEENGIVAYSNEGFAFLYMGKTERCESTNIIKRKYKLWRKLL